MITEALLGAKLVLSGLVGTNDTPARAFVMALHFMNSLFLTGSLTWLYLSHCTRDEERTPLQWSSAGLKKWLLRLRSISAFLFFIIGATGTIAALSNTLYPSNSLFLAVAQDLNPDSHYLIRLRGLHPLLGLILGLSLTLIFYWLSELLPETQQRLRTRTYAVSVAFALTAIAGASTLLLHSPLALKLIHLSLIHGLWVTILFFIHACAYSGSQISDHSRSFPKAN